MHAVLTLFALVVFVELHAFKSRSARDEFMGELCLMLRLSVTPIVIINLLVSILSIVYSGVS